MHRRRPDPRATAEWAHGHQGTCCKQASLANRMVREISNQRSHCVRVRRATQIPDGCIRGSAAGPAHQPDPSRPRPCLSTRLQTDRSLVPKELRSLRGLGGDQQGRHVLPEQGRRRTPHPTSLDPFQNGLHPPPPKQSLSDQVHCGWEKLRKSSMWMGGR